MRRSAAAVVIVGVLGVAACGSTTQYQGTQPRLVVRDPTALIAASADATSAARTARMSATMDVRAPGLTAPISVAIDGEISLDGKQAVMRMDMSSFLGSFLGSSRKLVVEARLVGGVMYMDFGAMVRAIADGQRVPPALASVKWIKIDVSRLTGSGGVGSSPASFTQYLEYLRGVAANGVRTLGHEKVRGVATTHYSADIDKARLKTELEKARDKLPSSLRTLVDQSLGAFDHDVTIDVWIDDEGLTRRLSLGMTLSISGQTANMAMTMDLYDFGVPVDVRPPPAADVQDFSVLSRVASPASA